MWLSYDQILSIPQGEMPMPVLSDKVRSIVGGAIKAKSKGMYNHFMWMIEPGILATQGVTGFKRRRIRDYASGSRMKIFRALAWDKAQRASIIARIEADLALPWYRQRYDFLAYLGHLTGIRAIHSPWAEICSEKARYIPEFHMQNPSPQDVNLWLEKRKDFEVYGRYTPD